MTMQMEMEMEMEMGAQELPEDLFRRGLALSIGRGGRDDLIEAHACFNLAALRGNYAAARRREEVASELSRAEIALALRAARERMSTH